jgi:hypothetical protein
MRATTSRPQAKLISIKQAETEFGLPAALIRDLIHRGVLAAVRPPNIRRVFIVRADLERKLDVWTVR